MARIRTIKPEFFIDEELQDLEVAHPGAYCMLVYAGLWGHCSKEGVFEFRPRTLKLSILPFLSFEMAETLGLLEQAGFLRRFCVDGKEYGVIPSFAKHQRISGKEAQYSPNLPSPTNGSNGEATGKQRGKTSEAQEGEGEKEREEEQNHLVVGGGSVEPPRGAVPNPPPPQLTAEAVESEVARIKGVHLATCGPSSVPPLSLIRDLLLRGHAVREIDDVYQRHGGDIHVYRQRNIVERLQGMRDGTARASPPAAKPAGGKSRKRLADELAEIGGR